jgi:hypothetical protein
MRHRRAAFVCKRTLDARDAGARNFAPWAA